MRIVITGVTSFLGIHTAEALLQRGHEVIGLLRPCSRNRGKLERQTLQALRLAEIDFDILPEASRERYCAVWRQTAPKREKPCIDAWIHFGWGGEGSQGRSDAKIQEKNFESSCKAYYMAELLGAKKFLFAGSQAEYGRGTHEAPLPVSEYGKAKLRFGEWAAEQSGRTSEAGVQSMEFLHLRIFSVYGVGDHEGSLVNTLVESCLEEKALSLGDCTQQWNYLEIRDLARAMVLLSESGEAGTGIYDIAGEETKPLRKYVEEIYSIIIKGEGLKARTEGEGRLAPPLLRFGARGDNAEGAADMAPDTGKLRQLGFRESIPFSEGIRRLAESRKRADLIKK